MLKKTDIASVLQKSLLFLYLTVSVYFALTFVEGLSVYQLWIGYFYILMTARTVVASADRERHANRSLRGRGVSAVLRDPPAAHLRAERLHGRRSLGQVSRGDAGL